MNPNPAGNLATSERRGRKVFDFICAVALAASLATGAVFRLARPGSISLSEAEVFSWGMSRMTPVSILEFCRERRLDPGYYLVLKSWTSVIGDSPATLRGLSAGFGVLTILVVYWICAGPIWRSGPIVEAEERPRRIAALAAAGLVAIHANLISASRRVTPFSLVTLLAMLSWWAFLRAMNGRGARPAWGFAALVLGIVSTFVHQVAWISVAAQAIALLFIGLGRLGMSRWVSMVKYLVAIATMTAAIALQPTNCLGEIGGWDGLTRSVYSSATGMPEYDANACLIWLSMVVGALAFARPVARGMAALPAMIIPCWFVLRPHHSSLALNDPAQMAAFGDGAFLVYCGACLSRPRRLPLVSALGLLLAIPILLGAIRTGGRLPLGESAWAQVASHLAVNSHTRDFVLLDSPASFACLKYYESQNGTIPARLVVAFKNAPEDANGELFRPPVFDAAERVWGGLAWSVSQSGDLIPGVVPGENGIGWRKVVLGGSEKLVISRR